MMGIVASDAVVFNHHIDYTQLQIYFTVVNIAEGLLYAVPFTIYRITENTLRSQGDVCVNLWLDG